MKKLGNRGYVLVILTVFVPLMLLSTRYVLDYSTERTDGVGKIVKRCAKEAALEVAKKWNPGLSYKQQKESMLRIADEVYNSSPATSSTTIKYEAIPGLEMPIKANIIKSGHYDPLKVVPTEYINANNGLGNENKA